MVVYFVACFKDSELHKGLKWDKAFNVICISNLMAYFITNIFSIGYLNKAPIDTIIKSLKNEGFKHEYMKLFVYEKYYIYFIIYLFSFILISGLKIGLDICRNRSELNSDDKSNSNEKEENLNNIN